MTEILGIVGMRNVLIFFMASLNDAVKLSSQNGCGAAVTAAAIGRARIDMHGSVSYRFLHRHHLNQDFVEHVLWHVLTHLEVIDNVSFKDATPSKHPG